LSSTSVCLFVRLRLASSRNKLISNIKNCHFLPKISAAEILATTKKVANNLILKRISDVKREIQIFMKLVLVKIDMKLWFES